MKEREEKIALIDGDSILYTAFYGNKKADEITGEPMKVDGKFVIIPKTEQEIMETLDGILHNLFEEGDFSHYILFIRGENCRKDRMEINPEYKQNRVKEIPREWEFTKQYAIEKWKAEIIDDIEVDDAIRICSKNIKNSHIVAIDKDLLWLEGKNFNWRKNEWTIVGKKEEEYYFSRSLVIGDTVDNVKGIKGKGEAFCNKIQINTIPDAFVAYLNEIQPKDKAVEEFFKNFKSLYILEQSDKYTQLPHPIKIEYNDDGENKGSRSTTGNLSNT